MFNKTREETNLNPFSLRAMNNEELMIKRVTIEKKHQSQKAYFSPEGDRKSVKLSSDYYSKIEFQLNQLFSTIFKPLAKFTTAGVKLIVNVRENGDFDLDNLEVHFHVGIPEYKNAEEALRTPLKTFLPFAEYVTRLHSHGHAHRLVSLTTTMRLSAEDVAIVLEDPSIIAPSARKQWFAIGTFIMAKSKTEHNFDMSTECYDGELVWDNYNVAVKQLIRLS